jgi:hypothetical protein
VEAHIPTLITTRGAQCKIPRKHRVSIFVGSRFQSLTASKILCKHVHLAGKLPPIPKSQRLELCLYFQIPISAFGTIDPRNPVRAVHPLPRETLIGRPILARSRVGIRYDQVIHHSLTNIWYVDLLISIDSGDVWSIDFETYRKPVAGRYP